MAFNIRRVDYFYTTVKDQPGEAYRLLPGSRRWASTCSP